MAIWQRRRRGLGHPLNYWGSQELSWNTFLEEPLPDRLLSSFSAPRALGASKGTERENFLLEGNPQDPPKSF